MQDKRSKILEKVRALLAKADSTTFPEEADAFRAKADDLMRAYAIEAWQVEQAQAGASGEAAKPEVRHLDFTWWRTSRRSDELWDLFYKTARHCRCVVATRGYGDQGYNVIPVIGLPSDLDYFDLLFTHLMLQLGKQLGEGAHANPNLSLGENARRLRETGMQRAQVCKLLWEAGLVELTGQWSDYDNDDTHWEWLPAGAQKAVRAKVRKAGEAYEQEHGLESTTGAHPETWQRSFATAFVQELSRRFREMRAAQDKTDTTGSMALAVRDIRQVALDLYTQMWPEPEDTGKRSSRALTYKEPKIDARAYSAGAKAGREAQLVGRADKGVKAPSNRQLGK